MEPLMTFDTTGPECLSVVSFVEHLNIKKKVGKGLGDGRAQNVTRRKVYSNPVMHRSCSDVW